MVQPMWAYTYHFRLYVDPQNRDNHQPKMQISSDPSNRDLFILSVGQLVLIVTSSSLVREHINSRP